MPGRLINQSIQQIRFNKIRTESPEIAAFKESARKLLELSFFKALGNFAEPETYPLTADERSIENLIYSRLVSLSAERQMLARTSFAAEKVRIEMMRPTYYNDMYAHDVLSALYNSESMFDRGRDYITLKSAPLLKIIELEQLQVMRMMTSTKVDTFKVHLQLDSMVCNEETDEVGADKIALSAVYVNSRGDSDKKDPFLVSNSFDVNDVVHFPRNNYITWDLLKINDIFPKSCVCTFIMSELDNGGLPGWVEKFYFKLSDKLKELIIKAGSKIPVPILGPAIGFVVAEVVAWLLDILFGWFVKVWEDDVFPPRTIQLDIPDQTYRFPHGGERLAYNTCQFQGHDGRYTLSYTLQFERVFKSPYEGDFGIPVAPETNGINGAIIYRDVRFGGESKHLKPGKHIFQRTSVLRIDRPGHESFDNDIDSIKVGTGFVVYAYKSQDFTGEPLELYSSDDVSYLDDNWRDQISSIFITTVEAGI